MWNGGNQWSGWVAYLSFFRHVAQLKLPQYEAFDHYEKAAIHGGPRIMHPDFCMVSDRPEFIHQDEQNRPHCEDGPFTRWRDGWALYAVHGVTVPERVITDIGSYTAEEILTEPNAEVRRVMIDRYGPERIAASGEKLHTDDWGTLWRVELEGDEPLVMVEVVNSTPEPDGSSKNYHLRVHPELRPILAGAIVGEPQEMTALNAIASTFGQTGREYADGLVAAS